MRFLIPEILGNLRKTQSSYEGYEMRDEHAGDHIDPSPFCGVEQGRTTREVILSSITGAEGGSGGVVN